MQFNNTKLAYEYLKKSIAVFVGAMLFLGVILSNLYVAEELVHDCTGEECPICQTIAECEAFVSRISTGLIVIAAAFAIGLILCKEIRIFCKEVLFETPISNKVRLNN